MFSLYRPRDQCGKLCQGRLLAALKSYLMSSHHSIVISRPYTVVLGADSLTANEPTKQEFSAIRSIPHPNYDGHANDIMLLKVRVDCCLLHCQILRNLFITVSSLNEMWCYDYTNLTQLTFFCIFLPLICLSQLDRSAQLTEAVQLIPLTTSRLKTSSRCITAGWGDVADNGTLPIRLQEVNVTTLQQKTCRRRWSTVPITRTMVCGVGARSFQGFCSVREYTGKTWIRHSY